MPFLLPVLVFLLALTISLIVIRVGTMALMLTGLSREAARFQSHSAFTGVGFTTNESETIVEHPVRRHLTMGLMMLGNIGMATVIATLTATLLSKSTSEHWGVSFGVLALGVIVLWLLATSAWIERQFNRPIAFALRKFSKLQVRDYVSLLQLSSGFSVSELLVEQNDWIADKTLVELGLAREGVLVLGIRRHNGIYLGAPSSSNRIEANDTLVIYGPLERLEELDSRCCGAKGDQAHQVAAREYDEYLEELQKSESHQ
ncbi:MAG: potassium transporter TrkA [Planctomycetes bacterium]|nr:potassium transporter TrkA [Planctomycetota bacterium]